MPRPPGPAEPTAPTTPGAWRAQFQLDPAWTFLNHGSFGATPSPVRDAQRRWMAELEAQPVAFLVRRLPELLAALRAELAPFVGARPDDLAIVSNATAGVQAVLASARLRPGDRLLTTSHRYGAVRAAMDRAAADAGASVVEVELPVPVPDPDHVVSRMEAALDEQRPALLIFDQITSPTGLVLPAARVAAAARARGVPVLIDGAHAPGHIDVDLAALGADWWVGNLHKWLCAPKTAALLWTHPERQAALRPAVPSHGHGQGMRAEFDWPGTFDPSPWLASADALRLHAAWGGPALRAAHLKLAAQGRAAVREALPTLRPASDHPAMLGALAAWRLDLPDAAAPALWSALHHHRIELPVFGWAGSTWMRTSSFAAYNTAADVERLVEVLPRAIAELRP